jgi:hypothetical protein
MDEERGDRRSRKGLAARDAVSSSSFEERTSLAAASLSLEHDDDEAEEREEFLSPRRLEPELESKFDDEDSSEDDVGDSRCEREGFLGGSQKQPTPLQLQQERENRSLPFGGYWDTLLHKTLLPDGGLSFRGHSIIEASGATTKLLKFVCWTFVWIGVVHAIVAHVFDDRDRLLKIMHIIRYEADLIVRDCFVFFVVGRLWEKPGIDHLAWMGTALLANVYFESQNFLWFLQHSVTLFEMHCLWPWELWAFALVLVVSAAALVAAHALKAWRDRHLLAKLTELGLCVLLFMAPMVTSDYFHLHHWYAGWLMGMQFNYDVW